MPAKLCDNVLPFCHEFCSTKTSFVAAHRAARIDQVTNPLSHIFVKFLWPIRPYPEKVWQSSPMYGIKLYFKSVKMVAYIIHYDNSAACKSSIRLL